MVGAKLHVKAILCLPGGTDHDPSVVNEHVNALLLVNDGLGAFPDGLDGRQVELHDLNSALGLLGDLIAGIVCLVHVSAEEDEASSPGAQVLGGLLTDASVCTCN